MEVDRNQLKKWGLNMPVLATSTKKDKYFQHNNEFVQLLTGNKWFWSKIIVFYFYYIDISNSQNSNYSIKSIFMGHKHSRVVYTPPSYVHVGPTNAQLRAKARKLQEENARLQENQNRF